MQGLDWRGNPIDPAKLLAKFNLKIAPGVNVGGGKVWKIVGLWETHGRPELRMVVDGTTDPVTFFARTTGGLELVGLRTEMKDDAGTMRNILNLSARTESYYEPRKMPGPWTFSVQNAPSDTISGLGLAVDPLGDNPPMEQDNRYLSVQTVWRLDDGSIPPVVVPPVVPDPTPQPPQGPSAGDLAGLQAYVDKRIDERLAVILARIKAVL